MALAVDRHLAELERRGGEDRRNGSYKRHLLGALGDVELHVPRTRRFSAKAVLGAYARRTREIDRLILGCFVLGLSTRKVGTALLPLLGERVSATVVSQVAKTLDGAVAAFHQRPLQNGYRALLFDGVVLARKTGAGALRRPVLVALGIRPDGRREVIDWRLAQSESEAEWQRFLTNLMQRGLTGVGVEIVGTDGGAGLLAALEVVFPSLPVQRCWAHKIRNITEKVRKADRDAVKRSLRAIYNAESRTKARSAARRFANRWKAKYPAAVSCLQRDLDELLTFFSFKDPKWRKSVRTTNAIERRFREVRRRTRPMGVFSDRTSMDRILYAVFTHENRMQGVSPLFLVTQNS
jgi:transposase-like protein